MKHINFKLIHFPFVVLKETGPTPPPVETFYILTESGDRILTESGDFMVLEQSP